MKNLEQEEAAWKQANTLRLPKGTFGASLRVKRDLGSEARGQTDAQRWGNATDGVTPLDKK
jgi:hypothetical protein